MQEISSPPSQNFSTVYCTHVFLVCKFLTWAQEMPKEVWGHEFEWEFFFFPIFTKFELKFSFFTYKYS
jgi:hypothetical protein